MRLVKEFDVYTLPGRPGVFTDRLDAEHDALESHGVVDVHTAKLEVTPRRSENHKPFLLSVVFEVTLNGALSFSFKSLVGIPREQMTCIGRARHPVDYVTSWDQDFGYLPAWTHEHLRELLASEAAQIWTFLTEEEGIHGTFGEMESICVQ